MEVRYLSLNLGVVHLGDCTIYGIGVDIVAMEVKYLGVGEGLRDLSCMGGG